jgi:hypothetical protein
LDTLPDAAGSDLGVLELLHRLNTGQAIPNGYEALGGPAGHQSRQFLLARKLSNGVAVAAVVSSAEPNAVMLFWSSIVKVVIVVLLGATLCVVMTWITPICLKSKAIDR